MRSAGWWGRSRRILRLFEYRAGDLSSGHLAETRPPGYALRIPAGGYLQFQIHYSNHHGLDVKDRTSIGLVFAREPVQHEIGQYEIWNNMFLILPTTTITV